MHIAYIAGFFDGEGCVLRSHGGVYYLQFTQASTPVLHQIIDTLGHWKVHGKCYHGVRATNLMILDVRGATRTMRLMLPHLIVKREKVATAIVHNKTVIAKIDRRERALDRAIAHYRRGYSALASCRRFRTHRTTLLRRLKKRGLFRHQLNYDRSRRLYRRTPASL